MVDGLLCYTAPVIGAGIIAGGIVTYSFTAGYSQAVTALKSDDQNAITAYYRTIRDDPSLHGKIKKLGCETACILYK